MMYWDREDHSRAFARLDEVDGQIHCYLKELLDEYQGEKRPQRYYDILAGYWLQWLAHSVVVALGAPGGSGAGAASSTRLAVHHTEVDFVAHVTDEKNGFHALLRLLLEGRAGDQIGFESGKAVFMNYPGSRSGRIARFVKRWMAKIGNPDAILVCHPYAKCSMLAWLTFVVRARKVMRWDDLQMHAQGGYEVAIDRDWRLAKFKAAGEGSSLLDAIKRLLPLFIPVAYLEGLRELRAAALRVPVGSPKGFYTANALYHHLLFKLLAAEHQQSTLLLGHQHGGSYGMELRHAPEEYERSVCDIFYTWGWDEGSGETRALSPPAFKKVARRKRWALMLSLGDFPNTYYRIQFFPAADGAKRTIEDTLNFARDLPGIPAGKVLIRPSPTDYGRGWLDELRRLLPDAQVDRFEKGSIERFAVSEVVFHNYISTGWLESIWLDVPTLALYDPDVYAFRREVAASVDIFERFGLLHRSGSSAAKFYTAVRHDVEGWWNQPEFRSARAEFSAHYVRVRADWKQEWIDEFTTLLRNREAIVSRRQSRTQRMRVAGPTDGVAAVDDTIAAQ
jgi:hypothetical protein